MIAIEEVDTLKKENLPPKKRGGTRLRRLFHTIHSPYYCFSYRIIPFVLFLSAVAEGSRHEKKYGAARRAGRKKAKKTNANSERIKKTR